MRSRIAVTAALLTLIGLSPAVARGQRPERQHDVLVPGLGVRLREGWEMFVSKGCRYAVPVTWRPTPDRSQALAPDGNSISLWTLRVTNWPQRRAQLKIAYAADGHVREDSDARLWIESNASNPTRHFVAVSDSLVACGAVIEIRNRSAVAESDIEAIVDSVGGAQWPTDLK